MLIRLLFFVCKLDGNVLRLFADVNDKGDGSTEREIQIVREMEVKDVGYRSTRPDYPPKMRIIRPCQSSSRWKR